MPKTKNKPNILKEEKTMKKSTAYRMAQLAVIESTLDPASKLDILRVLISDEDIARFCEKEKEAKEA